MTVVVLWAWLLPQAFRLLFTLVPLFPFLLSPVPKRPTTIITDLLPLKSAKFNVPPWPPILAPPPRTPPTGPSWLSWHTKFIPAHELQGAALLRTQSHLVLGPVVPSVLISPRAVVRFNRTLVSLHTLVLTVSRVRMTPPRRCVVLLLPWGLHLALQSLVRQHRRPKPYICRPSGAPVDLGVAGCGPFLNRGALAGATAQLHVSWANCFTKPLMHTLWWSALPVLL